LIVGTFPVLNPAKAHFIITNLATVDTSRSEKSSKGKKDYHNQNRTTILAELLAKLKDMAKEAVTRGARRATI
jgi:hypothetical protein